MKFLHWAAILFWAFGSTTCWAGNVEARSPYAGQELRQIKSLSRDDVRQLQNGGGWGLAKAAELNGMPGPKHILEMKDQIALTREQEKEIQALFEAMKSDAIRLGVTLVELERTLDREFASRTITRSRLAELLDSIAEVRRDLRYVHLAAHLETPAILTKKQVTAYNRLRGYDSNDPCGHVPEGHDADMWRRHNGCE